MASDTGKVQKFRFRVVAPDGRELLSDVAHVRWDAANLPEFRVSEIFVKVKAQKQGELKTEESGVKAEHQFAALSVEYEVKSQRDVATGQPTGKRQHSPISLVKEWGAASPQLFQALVTNEVLETVDIDCYGVLASGKKAPVYKIKLTNASVATIRQAGGGSTGARELETVGFTFQKIELGPPSGGVSASDDLSTQR